MYEYRLHIAGIRLHLESEHPLLLSQPFAPFLEQDGQPDCTVRLRQVDRLPPIPAESVYEGFCFRVHRGKDGSFQRSFYGEPECRSAYAFGVYDHDRRHIEISYVNSAPETVWEIGSCFSNLGLESIMMAHGRVCLHAACVDTPMGGLLFTGPSGIGKSTQAQLWCRHRNARQINGDRPFLSCDGETWLAWGSPYAGSSRCYVNDCCPVSAIVLLRQAKQCSIRRLSQTEAFRCVYSGITANSWDPEYMGRACDRILQMIEEIPVYEFACTADLDAVRFLEMNLWKDKAP